MKLGTQMLLASAVTLAIPVVGWQSSRQLYLSLQDARMTALQRDSEILARIVSERLRDLPGTSRPMPPDEQRDWYAVSSDLPIVVDGFADDWQVLRPVSRSVNTDGESMSVRLARHRQRLYAFVDIRDDVPRWHRPPRPVIDPGENEGPDPATELSNGDALELRVSDPVRETNTTATVLLRALAPGVFDPLVMPGPRAGSSGRDARQEASLARAGDAWLTDWQAAWEPDDGGYQIEFALPLPPDGSRFDITWVDVDASGRSARRSTASTSSASRLFYRSEILQQELHQWLDAGSRIRLYDGSGWLRADVDALYRNLRPIDAGLWDLFMFRLFAWFVAGDLPLPAASSESVVPYRLSVEQRAALAAQPVIARRYVTESDDRVIGALATLPDATPGWLLIESNEEHASAYAGSRLARLFSLLLLVSLLAGLALSIYALILSLRIGRLSRQAKHAVGQEGRPGSFEASTVHDEIGELSRALGELLDRTGAYTGYLEALSSRLSHELFTPLSVIRTSLENIDGKKLDADTKTLVRRADAGASELAGILSALIDSTRLEQTVQHAEFQSVDLQAFLQGAEARYRQLYPEHRIERSETAPAGAKILIKAAPEQLFQALDKLVANAIDFSNDGLVRLIAAPLPRQRRSRSGTRSRYRLAVANRGLPLDPTVRSRLAEPMFSQRSGRGHAVHLGLGLYVVRLIAEAHGGKLFVGEADGWTVIGLDVEVLGQTPES